MPPLSLPLAVAAIIAPTSLKQIDHLSHLSPIIMHVASSWGLLNPGEHGKLFCEPAKFRDDLWHVRLRYRQCDGLPELWHRDRFPVRDECKRQLAFNRAYRQWLHGQSALYPDSFWLYEARCETDKLYSIWDAVIDAGDQWDVVIRRRNLGRLRDEYLTDAEWGCGQLPDVIPSHRFHSVD